MGQPAIDNKHRHLLAAERALACFLAGAVDEQQVSGLGHYRYELVHYPAGNARELVLGLVAKPRLVALGQPLPAKAL